MCSCFPDTELEDRLPPNEYSEYFGLAAVLHPPIVREKDNSNTPRYLEQVSLMAPLLTAHVSGEQC